MHLASNSLIPYDIHMSVLKDTVYHTLVQTCVYQWDTDYYATIKQSHSRRSRIFPVGSSIYNAFWCHQYSSLFFDRTHIEKVLTTKLFVYILFSVRTPSVKTRDETNKTGHITYIYKCTIFNLMIFTDIDKPLFLQPIS